MQNEAYKPTVHRIVLSNFGPVKECEITLNDMLVLSGPQANGKSTIAKAIFFFRTIKEDIDYCTQKYLKIGKYLQKKV